MIDYRSEEWFRVRIGKFTASVLPDLMARPADKSALISKSAMNRIEAAAAELYYNNYYKRPDSDAKRWGVRHENRAIQLFTERTNLQTRALGYISHPVIAAAGATPDAQVIDPTCLDLMVIAQIKCPYNPAYHRAYLKDIHDTACLKRKKSAFFWQMQGEMWITNAIYSYFVSFDPRLSGRDDCLHIVKIIRDEDAIRQIDAVVKRSIELRDAALHEFTAGIRKPKPLSAYY